MKQMQVNNTVNTHDRFFMMPNVIYNLGLSVGAIATYGYLMSHENRRRGDKDRFTCHPSYATIGNAIGRSARSVAKYVAELVEADMVAALNAAAYDWNDDALHRLRRDSIRNVKETNGRISFEQHARTTMEGEDVWQG